ncbi:30S ribosomal protein S20 [Desulfobacter hydrogenophilus]|uniref:Small ribosomal subunit protein bS20 n=1 Tax=Desulfobacter hydrogenophilus TaxID=2291 RepID=A0A328F9K9_9BACT|nr:30S ribosomal protein S20 [Desulfobacter hydrogenophilus]NDY72122.1 30S ribosomal protein S20 [Desulfobacter hydrogenophilus]QBH14847.1 30S ribosomal protein S20 [Desulfobacter hydrogenophilus]RAM01354.1 30S ribosomal protein S20 [Desulfobacter hydrogenophilus]
MANHKSAKKRAKQNQVRRMRNKSAKTSLKTLEKKLRSAKEAGENTDELMKKTQSAIHKAAKKGIVHKKMASRKISRLFKFANA